MLTRDSMRGLYVLPPTPMDERGEFCETRYRDNLRTLVEFGVDAIVSPGSNGEWWSLPDRDRRRQMELLVEACQGHCVSATCTSSTSTADSIEKTRWAQQIGVDAVMNVPPFYFPLTEDELHKYFVDLAEACPQIGLIVYNFPLVAQTLAVSTMQKLADELPTLAGSKESHNDLDVWLTLHRTTNLGIMSANERVWWSACAKLGGRGMFSVLTSAVPGLLTELQAACAAADWAQADALETEFRALVDLAGSRPYLKSFNRIAQAKALVNACGWLDVGTCRAPLISVPVEAIGRLREELLPRFERWLAPPDRRRPLIRATSAAV